MSNSLKDLVWWGLVAPLSIKSQCSKKPHSMIFRALILLFTQDGNAKGDFFGKK